MNIAYRVAIDRDHSGDFAAAEDISADAIGLRWRLGMRAPYDSMADYGSAVITLRNASGKYSPERTPLPIGARVRIQSRSAGVARTQFIGFISHIEVDGGDQGRKQATLHLRDIQPWLAQSAASLPPQVNARADQLIARLLESAVLRRAALAGYLFIDRAGSNRIDSARIFPAANVTRHLAAGKTRFAYVGDSWDEHTSVRQAIAELAASERGRFYISRSGAAVFLNRQYTLLHKAVAARFLDDMAGMRYSYGGARLNRLTLLMTPRTIGASGSLLWQLPRPQRIPARGQITLSLRLLDEREQPVGLLQLKRLEWRFQWRAEAGAARVAHNVSVKARQSGATALQAQVSNHHRQPVWLSALNVYGRPLYRGAPLEVRAESLADIHIEGLRSQTRPLPALSNAELAQQFADYEVQQRRRPRGAIRELLLEARAHPAAALGLSLFDRVQISESHTGHKARDYFIVAEAHEVSDGGASHQTRWTLEPADMQGYFVVNSHRVDSATEHVMPF